METFTKLFGSLLIEYCRDYVFKPNFPIHRIFERTASSAEAFGTREYKEERFTYCRHLNALEFMLRLR